MLFCWPYSLGLSTRRGNEKGQVTIKVVCPLSCVWANKVYYRLQKMTNHVAKIYENKNTRLFIWKDDRFWYTDWGVYRIMHRGDRERVILHSSFNEYGKLRAIKGDIIHIVHREAGRFDEYRKEDVIIRFRNCKLRNLWMPNVVISRYENMDILRVYAEVECDIEYDKSLDFI